MFDDPAFAARVEELFGDGRLSGDAIGQAQWEQAHADDVPPWTFTPDREVAIRDRWLTGDPAGPDCGETRIRTGRDHAVLETLRHARSDVATLYAEIRRLRRTPNE